MDILIKQKINKVAIDLIYMVDQMDIIGVYRTFHPTAAENPFYWHMEIL